MIKKNLHIKSYCSIKDNTIYLNGDLVYQSKENDFSVFIKAAYKAFETKYPKFFKMDGLSKLAFLAADLLLKNEGLDADKEHDIAIVFANKASSLDTDRKHQESIQDSNNYYPSPAVFVYTLPNICIGEISIKYKLYSENSFFIFDSFDAAHLYSYSESLIKNNKATSVLCGWVDYEEDNYDAFLYLVDAKGNIEHNKEEITRLYNK